jgi:hypothetical protein
MSDLKPCPFCGESDQMEEDGSWCDAWGCTSCITSNGYVVNWNSRPIEDRLRKERDELKADLRRLGELYDIRLSVQPAEFIDILAKHRDEKGGE